MCLPSKLAEDFNIWCKWKNKPMNFDIHYVFLEICRIQSFS
jgi:hypothetical protein